MILYTSPPEQKAAPGPGNDHGLNLFVVRQHREQVAQLGVNLKGQRIQRLRPVEGDEGNRLGDLVAEIEIGH
jgi:hypothetical protein